MSYNWTAVYDDGTEVNHENEDGSVNRYHDLDKSRLSFFTLYVDDTPYTVSLGKGVQLIYVRRVRQDLGGNQKVLYILGWRKQVKGENVQSIMFIGDEGVLQADTFGEGMFEEPKLF